MPASAQIKISPETTRTARRLLERRETLEIELRSGAHQNGEHLHAAGQLAGLDAALADLWAAVLEGRPWPGE